MKQAVPFFGVTDIEASLRFYVEGLGFVVKNRLQAADDPCEQIASIWSRARRNATRRWRRPRRCRVGMPPVE